MAEINDMGCEDIDSDDLHDLKKLCKNSSQGFTGERNVRKAYFQRIKLFFFAGLQSLAKLLG